ncbi:MAG: glycosyltransferase family 2 protein [Acidimicrobiales bacterium]
MQSPSALLGVCELSVIIPCRNAMPWLTEQLDALAGEHTSFAWEVVVSDNGSTDRSAEVVSDFAGRMDIRVIDSSDRPGAAAARNAGVAASRGLRLVFLDADDVIAPGYLRRMDIAIGEYGLAAGRIDSVTLNPEWAARAVRARTAPPLFPGPPYRAIGTSALGITRQLFTSVGGFDESFGSASEDLDFCWRVQRANSVTLTMCDAVLYYRLRPDPLALFRQARAHGCSNVKLYRKWRTSGMEAAPARLVARRWASALGHLALAWRGKEELARGLYLSGMCLGRIQGSISHRVVYL